MLDAGPFYMAYVADDSVAFDPAVHNVMDEYVFSLRRILSETDKPVMEVEMLNPHIGLLNSSRDQWAWFSELNPANGHIEPTLLGRLVGNPSHSFAEIITVQFVSWPSDYFKQRQTVAETLKVPPFWDEVFVSVADSDNPDTILESRGALWCVNPVTLQVTAEDIINGSDGNVDVTADAHFYDAFDMRDGDAPLTSVLIDATVSWTQTGRGLVDMGAKTIHTYSGDGLLSDWPKPLTQLGSGWSVQYASAIDANHTAAATTVTVSYSWQNPEQKHADGDTLSVSFSASGPALDLGRGIDPGGGHASGWLNYQIIIGFLDPFATDGDGDPSPTNRPAGFSGTAAQALVWSIATTLVLRYDLSRQRTERVLIMMNADLQSVVNDPLVTQNSETITLNSRDLGVPIVNLLNWTTVSDTDVTVPTIIFPDNPTLPGGKSAQALVLAGHTGTKEPQFSDVPGTITVDGTAHWASLGTQNPTEGANDWTGSTGYNPGAIILPRYPFWADLDQLLAAASQQFPPQGVQLGYGEIVKSGSNYLVCTEPGLVGGIGGGSSASLTSLGPALPDGKTYYLTPNGGTSGAVLVTPTFGQHTAVGDSVTDNGITWVSIGSGDIPAGGNPGNVWASTYIPGTRGRKSLEYLMAVGRARIRKRARAVELDFECDHAVGRAITCRKTVTLHDTRIPGGLAVGKVMRAELTADGDSGECKCVVTIGCAVGFGNAVTTAPGTPVYATSGYMQSGYQQEVGGVVVLPDLSDVGYTPPIAEPEDDGLVLPLTKEQVVLKEGILGTLSGQAEGVASALGSMAAAAQLAQSVAELGGANAIQGELFAANSLGYELSKHPIWYEASIKPVVNGPFYKAYTIITQPVTVEQGINLEGASTP